MTDQDHSDHNSDVVELKVKLEDLFSHVQAWQQHAERQQTASEGLAELKAKAQKLLGLIDKAEQGLIAMQGSAKQLDGTLEMLDALGGELKKTASQSAATIDEHLAASSLELKKQFAALQQAGSESLSRAVAKEVAKLATTEQVDRLATKEQVAKLATADQVTKLATADEVRKLATADQVKDLATAEQAGKLATADQVRKLATADQVKWALIASSLAAASSLIALAHGFLRG